MELIAEYGEPGVSVQLADVPVFVTDSIPRVLAGSVKVPNIVCETGATIAPAFAMEVTREFPQWLDKLPERLSETGAPLVPKNGVTGVATLLDNLPALATDGLPGFIVGPVKLLDAVWDTGEAVAPAFAIKVTSEFSKWLTKLPNSVIKTGAPIAPKNGAPAVGTRLANSPSIATDDIP